MVGHDEERLMSSPLLLTTEHVMLHAQKPGSGRGKRNRKSEKIKWTFIFKRNYEPNAQNLSTEFEVQL